MTLRSLVLIAALAGMAAPALSQGARLPFAGLPAGSAQTVEVVADSLSINQADQTAIFAGDVRVGIGELRLSAAQVQVVYATGDGTQPGQVRALRASGGVTVTNGIESAESDTAIYEIEAGQILLEGNVLLTQGQSAISGQRLRIDLIAETALMEGRVQTVLRTEGTEAQ